MVTLLFAVYGDIMLIFRDDRILALNLGQDKVNVQNSDLCSMKSRTPLEASYNILFTSFVKIL